MIFLVGVAAAVAVIAALTARWTRLHPLVIGLLGWLIGAVLGVLTLGVAMSPAALPGGIIAGLPLGMIAALAAFVGWLARKHRIRNG